jgi:hypothetical protein
MSFEHQEDHLLSVTDEEVEEGMDTEILDSSGHKDSKQDQMVDETAPDQDSTPKVTKDVEAVEQMDSTPSTVEADKVVDEGAAEAGEENLDLHECTEKAKSPDEKEEVVTLSESNEVKDIDEKEAAMALSGDVNEKSPQEVARLAQAALDQMEDFDTFLDLVMMDHTMSIAKAKKSGDVVVLVPFPHEDHKVCLTEGKQVLNNYLTSLYQ